MPPHAGGAARSADTLRGRLLDGRYRLGDRIARGGMASVHEAVDVRLDRTVAVKIMHAGLADADADRDFAERFVREARAAARLNHPHVVQVHDQGDDDGTLFLVMELVAGHTLRDTVVRDAPLSPARALAVLEPVLAALAAAHRAGLVHRDVKPENVLVAVDPVTGAETIKVADFGLARAVTAETHHTATQGVLIGTVSYLAPELVVDGRADQRADVYAAGVMLYELLTGVKPHAGETPIQVAYRHVHHDVPAPSQRVPGLPAYVDALVARATARDRTRRPADAAVMLHQLHRVASALADGVRDDPELTLDLTPLPSWTEPGDDTAPDTGRPDHAPHHEGTTVEPWDQAELDALLAASPELREPATVPPSPPPLVRREPDRATATFTDVGAGVVPPPPTARPPLARPPGRSDRTHQGGPAGPAGSSRPTGPSRPRRRRRGLLVLLLALLLAVGIGGGAFWYGWARYDPAPSVTGRPEADAVAALEAAGLEVAFTDPVWSGDDAAGTVVDAEPRGGEQVLDGDTVTLTLSRGTLRAPRVRGLDEDAAQDALQRRDLEVGDARRRFSETVPEGTVLGSRPAARTELRPGATVSLVVSRGRRPLRVGRWVGEPFADARDALTGRGLQVEVAGEEFSDTVAEGDVIAQTPLGGTLYSDDTVSFTVSLGPDLVEVPRVRLFGVDAARTALTDAGFDVEVEEASTYFGLGFAVGTDPEPGTMVPRGSTITILVT